MTGSADLPLKATYSQMTQAVPSNPWITVGAKSRAMVLVNLWALLIEMLRMGLGCMAPLAGRIWSVDPIGSIRISRRIVESFGITSNFPTFFLRLERGWFPG